MINHDCTSMKHRILGEWSKTTCMTRRYIPFISTDSTTA